SAGRSARPARGPGWAPLRRPRPRPPPDLLEVRLDPREHAVLVEHEGRMHPGDLLERALQRVAGILGEPQRVDQHPRVVRLERFAAPRAMPLGLEHLLDQEFAIAVPT